MVVRRAPEWQKGSFEYHSKHIASIYFHEKLPSEHNSVEASFVS